MKTEFKVGDWVSSKYFEGVKQIKAIVDPARKAIDVGGVYDCYFTSSQLTLVCGFVKGEHVLADGDFDRIFVQYRPELINPFECVAIRYEEEFKNGEPYFVSHWKYAKAIEPKYKAYAEPKLEWIGKKVKDKFGVESTIRMIGSGYVNFKENNNEVSCEDLFKNYTWLDGSICGDKI